MAERLQQALREANVEHRCEIYPHVRHGFAMADFPVYDQVAALRHWREPFTLFDEILVQ
jgi:carboxymethylenebutenolidase